MLSEEFEAIFNDFSTKLKSIEEYEREAKVIQFIVSLCQCVICEFLNGP